MVTVVDAFLTVIANQASSTELKGIVSSEMLRNKLREVDETIGQKMLLEGARVKSLLKTITTIVASVALVCCLSGCSSQSSEQQVEQQSQSKEEMVAAAQDFVYDDFENLQEENEAKAEAEYDGKIFKRTAFVEEVRTNYFILSDKWGDMYISPIVVELPQEELVELSVGDEVTVVGEFGYEPDPNISKLVNVVLIEE